MSTKEIKQITPDYFALHYAGQHVGHASTEAEGKAKLDEIAYDVEFRGQPIPEAPLLIACRLVDQIIAQQTAALPIPPADLIARLVALPDYVLSEGGHIAHAGTDPRGDTPAGCTQRYLTGIEAGVSNDALYVPLLYHHEGELWVSTGDQHDIAEPGHCDLPQRVLSISPVPCTDLIAVVAADEMFLMERRDVEVQIGATVRLERFDHIPERAYDSPFGGWQCMAGPGDSYQTGMVELYFPDDDGEPALYMLGRDGDNPAEVEAILPQLIALFADPRVIEARRRVDAGLPPFEEQRKAA